MAKSVPSGLRSFLILWSGQLITIIGSALTSFALGIFIYQQHGSTSELALVILAFSLPGILATPLAGALLDRWDRRWVLALSALGCGLSTLAIAFADHFGGINTWQVYLCVAGISFFGAAQGPALTLFTAILIPKEHYARANGFWQLTQGLVLIVSPLMAAVLLSRFGIKGIVITDFFTYVVAIASLAFVALPKSAKVPDYADKPHPLSWGTLIDGWSYVWKRPGLLHLLCFVALVHFILDMIQILVVPMALGFGGPKDLATIISVSSLGMMVGGVAMAVWGGPKHRIWGVLGALFALGVGLAWAGLSPTVPYVAVGMFVLAAAIPIALSCNGAIWQVKVETKVQGRVFAFESVVAQSAQPIACVLAGPLTDKIFNPMVSAGTRLHSLLGPLAGTGQGRGAGILMALLGVLAIAAALFGSLSPRLRRVELDMPDAVQPGPKDMPNTANELAL